MKLSDESVSFIDSYIADAAATQSAILAIKKEIVQSIEALAAVIKNGGKIYLCGNGGSACEAMHFSEELVARYLRHRPAIPAQHFCDASTITCWANDYEFDTAFQRQVEAFVGEKDALIVLTSSGNSKNIILAIEAAKKRGALTIGLLGKDGGAAKNIVDIALTVPSTKNSHAQEGHLTLVHIICDRLELLLFPDAKAS